MKKITTLGMIALVMPLLCLLAVSSCKTEEDDPAKMTFESTDATKRLTINENFEFKVVALDSNVFMSKGDWVSGKINTSGKWKENLTGIAYKMTTNQDSLRDIIESLEMNVDLTYTWEDNNITAVTLLFTGEGYASVASSLMGGTFIKK